MNRSLGVALIPAEHICTRMYQIVSALSEELELSFMLAPGASIPHVSLMQGVFTTECAERFVDEFLTGPLPATYVEKRYPLSETAYLWDGRILFFNLAYSPDLRALHEHAFKLVYGHKIPGGLSADPQPFAEITDGQRRSFAETGYPFSQDEYLPHFTWGHLSSRVPAQEQTSFCARLAECFSQAECRFGLLGEVEFTEMVVFEVQPKGICRAPFVAKR